MVSNRGRVSCPIHVNQAPRTAGHQHRRCSAPASPWPHNGHTSYCVIGHTSGPGSGDFPTRMRKAIGKRWSPMTASGAAAQMVSVDQSPLHREHHASPSPAGPGVVQAKAGGCPHAVQRRGNCARAFAVRRPAEPGMPPVSIRRTWSAQVRLGACSSRVHSRPLVRPHRLSADLRCVQAR